MNPTETTEKLKSVLLSKRIKNFKLLEYGSLILYFDSLTDEPETFWIEAPWRIVVNDRIQCGYLEDAEKVLAYLNANVKDRTVTNIYIDLLSDLRLTIQGELELTTFVYFADSDQWEYRSGKLRIGCEKNFILCDSKIA